MRSVGSVMAQTFKDYDLYICDDHSTDNTASLAKTKYKEQATVLEMPENRTGNGSTRNYAMEVAAKKDHYDYVLFLDADDNFINAGVFENLARFIQEKHNPDMVRLPYIRVEPSGSRINQAPRLLSEKNIADVAKNCRVACWTKAVKFDKFKPFPEHTLMEDVCQHLEQCDITTTLACFPEAIIEWRIRSTSTSKANSDFWKESAFRFPYDLYTLKLKREYTKSRRDEKLKEALRNLSEGKFQQ